MADMTIVRCPYCKKLNPVDVSQELEDHQNDGFGCFLLPLAPPDLRASVPEYISVVCAHCGKAFKIKLQA